MVRDNSLKTKQRLNSFLPLPGKREKMRRLINQRGLLAAASGSVSSSSPNSNAATFVSRRRRFLLPLASQCTSIRFLDFYQIGNKEAIEKERARLADEMNRGYFADISELKQHGGKIALANKVMIPAMVAVKFPPLQVNYSDGTTLKLPPITEETSDNSASQKASLICLSFRANSQAMVDSWSLPFREAFKGSKDIQMYEVSLIDSWLLSLKPVKQLLLRTMRKSNPEESKDALQRQIVYSFGDNYYFRKELKILNLLTGYVFLLDRYGRIRWQGFGTATPEELSSLMSCTSALLEEK